jgi:hypothetical protein
MTTDLKMAQQKFADFETTTVGYDAGTIDFIASTIKGHVAKSGFDLAVLDTSGHADAAQMEARLSATTSRLHGRLAR